MKPKPTQFPCRSASPRTGVVKSRANRLDQSLRQALDSWCPRDCGPRSPPEVVPRQFPIQSRLGSRPGLRCWSKLSAALKSPAAITMRYLVRTLLPMAISLLSASALAANLMFLNDAAISAMTDEDITLFQRSLDRALESTPDGEAYRWDNVSTGAHGTMTPARSFQRGGQRCRHIQFQHTVQGRTGNGDFSFCRQQDGSWKIVTE